MGGLCWKLEMNKENTPKSRVKIEDHSMLELRRRRRDAEEYSDKIELKMKEAEETMRKYARTKNKAKAIFALKMKKMYQSTLHKISGVVLTLEKTISNIEQSVIDVNVHNALEQGQKSLAELRSKVSMEDFQELYEKQKESDPVGDFLQEEAIVDEKEFAEELDQLGSEEKEENVEEIKDRMELEDLKAPVGEISLPIQQQQVPNKNDKKQQEAEGDGEFVLA